MCPTASEARPCQHDTAGRHQGHSVSLLSARRAWSPPGRLAPVGTTHPTVARLSAGALRVAPVSTTRPTATSGGGALRVAPVSTTRPHVSRGRFVSFLSQHGHCHQRRLASQHDTPDCHQLRLGCVSTTRRPVTKDLFLSARHGHLSSGALRVAPACTTRRLSSRALRVVPVSATPACPQTHFVLLLLARLSPKESPLLSARHARLSSRETCLSAATRATVIRGTPCRSCLSARRPRETRFCHDAPACRQGHFVSLLSAQRPRPSPARLAPGLPACLPAKRLAPVRSTSCRSCPPDAPACPKEDSLASARRAHPASGPLRAASVGTRRGPVTKEDLCPSTRHAHLAASGALPVGRRCLPGTKALRVARVSTLALARPTAAGEARSATRPPV